jgi:hypothetical protein
MLAGSQNPYQPLLTTALPQTAVEVLEAELSTSLHSQWLRIKLRLRSNIIRDIVQGTSLAELVYHLSVRWGFTAQDASFIVAHASGGN